MATVRLKIDLAGTVGNEAWESLTHFDGITEARFGPEHGSSGPCRHAAASPHPAGEWAGAVVVCETNLLAQYAMSHYLHQERVLDADIEE
jgi:hypothetical protein